MMGAESPIENANLSIWNALSRTDPAHTKSFKRGGGFTGTAIKPIWIVKMLTEQFGPCGTGWGMDEPKFEVVQGDNREVLVYCTVGGWYSDSDGQHNVFGVGGDKVVTYYRANQNRPERWENDDEAFKKAFTDAVGNAFKFLGVGADVHMGLFDDSKYVAEVRQEFAEQAANEAPAEPAPRTKLDGPHTSKTALRKAVVDIIGKVRAAASNEEIDAIQKENIETIRQANKDWPALLTGDPNIEEDVGLKGAVQLRREQIAKDEDGQLQMLIASLKGCETLASLTNWMATNESFLDELDDAERRTFELARDLHESGLMAVARVNAG